MIIVHPPEIEHMGNDNVKLKVSVEVNNVRKEMWYSTTPEFSPYFCHERSDAFILPLLFYAMKRNLAIKLEAPISERLYYTITNYLSKALSYTFKSWHEVLLDCPITSDLLLNAGAVGTGLSGGIDSFCTVADHVSDLQPKGYKLTHCTFFNVGGHNPQWTGPDKTQELFKKRTDHARRCAEDLKIPLVVVDSNMEEILGNPFAPTHTFRTVSAVLSLQKLFRIYYYSSGHSAYDFNFNPNDCSDYDIFSLPMVSTEGLDFFSAGTFHTRVKKTEIVTTVPSSYRHLNVCVFEDGNCSKCEKCMRTLLTLDLLKKLHLYKDVFDLDVYQLNKDWFIGHVLAGRGRNPHYREIYTALIEHGLTRGQKLLYYFAWYRHRVTNKIIMMLGGENPSKDF